MKMVSVTYLKFFFFFFFFLEVENRHIVCKTISQPPIHCTCKCSNKVNVRK